MKTWSPKQPARLFAQAKLDGHWLSVERVSMSTVRCLTRTPTELDLAWVPSLKNAWSRLPIGQTLHGELWVPGRRASQVKSCLARRDVSVRFTAFSVATMASHAPLSLVNEMCALWGFDFAPWWWTREHATVEQHLTHAQDAMLDLGHSHRCAEGVVFKDGNTMNEVKYKPTRTMDLVVTGVKDAALTSKNLGLVGSITGAVWTSEWLVDEPVLDRKSVV